MRIRWTDPAIQALESIQDSIAKDNPRAAFEIAQRIRIVVSQLEEQPKMGRKGRVRGTHELVIAGAPYIIPYRIKNEEIQVLSVYHTSRKWPDRFS